MNQKDKKYIEKTLKKYDEKKVTKLDELKCLDKKAKRGANIFAYVFGIVGTLVLGIGMCLAMNIIASGVTFMVVGILIGLVGIAMVSLNYFIYKTLLKKGRAKYADQIRLISNELLNC